MNTLVSALLIEQLENHESWMQRFPQQNLELYAVMQSGSKLCCTLEHNGHVELLREDFELPKLFSLLRIETKDVFPMKKEESTEKRGKKKEKKKKKRGDENSISHKCFQYVMPFRQKRDELVEQESEIITELTLAKKSRHKMNPRCKTIGTGN